MMMKFLVSAVLAAGTAQAQDLESLLEGQNNSAGASSAQQPVAQQTRLSFAVQSLVGKMNSEQRIFLRHLELSDWNKALLQFQSAFNGSSFERTENAQALEALLKVKSGLEISGLEQMMRIQNPKKVHSEIITQFKEVIKPDSLLWEIAKIQWNPGWTEYFGREAEVQSKLRDISIKSDLATLKKMSASAPVNTRERALIDWQLALSYALNDQADEAAKVLAALLKNEKSPISQDLINLTAGRLLFQNGYFDAAIKYYQKISKKSDYWVDSQEELAWSYLRKGEPQNALGISKTLMNPSLKGFVGAEAYFVASLGHLKVCDYPLVMETLVTFPKHFRSRTLELSALSKGEREQVVADLIEKMKKGPVTWEQLGSQAHSLPRMVNRDHKLIQLVQIQNAFAKEAAAADKLYAQSLALTGLQGKFDTLKKDTELRLKTSNSASKTRVEGLAAAEVKDIKRILDKLHIVEAELIQQVDMAGRISKHTEEKADLKKGEPSTRRSDALVFGESSEIWFDELSNFKVDVKKGCQSLKRSL